jgi:hypothetical protein
MIGILEPVDDRCVGGGQGPQSEGLRGGACGLAGVLTDRQARGVGDVWRLPPDWVEPVRNCLGVIDPCRARH